MLLSGLPTKHKLHDNWRHFGTQLFYQFLELVVGRLLCFLRNGKHGNPQLQRILRTRQKYPDVITAAHESRVWEDLMTLPGECSSWQRHAKEQILHHCGHYRTIRRVIEGRLGGFERQLAVLCQIYGVLESAAKDSGHDLAWAWPLLGLADPDARPDVHWSQAEASVVIA